VSGFGFVGALERTEAELAERLELWRVSLPEGLDGARGVLRGRPAAIEARAYVGPKIAYARFVTLRGDGIEIANLLCFGGATHRLPIFGADLVAVGPRRAMLAADLTPSTRDSAFWSDALSPLAERRARAEVLPHGGELPSYCAAFFSSLYLYVRVEPPQLEAALASFDDYSAVYADLVAESSPAPEHASEVARLQRAYSLSHRSDERGLELMTKAFGADFALAFVERVLFPAEVQA
jgi:hypothetical protein